MYKRQGINGCLNSHTASLEKYLSIMVMRPYFLLVFHIVFLMGGHVRNLNFPRNVDKIGAMATVQNMAPRKPSHVFFGESAMRGVRPNALPKTYAMTSFTTTSKNGNKNQIMPSNMFEIVADDCKKIIAIVMCVHANCENWYLNNPFPVSYTHLTLPTKA